MNAVSPLSSLPSNTTKKASCFMKAHSKEETLAFLLLTEVTVEAMKPFFRVMIVVEENNLSKITMGLCISQLV